MRSFATVVATAAAGVSLRRGAHVVDTEHVVDTKATAGNIWVPIQLPQQQTYYLNPTTSEERPEAPQGAYVMKAAAVVGYTGDLEEDHVPRQPTGPHGQLVPNDERLSCLPHCTWNCTQPVCEQDCQPNCHRPNCQTRCPKLGEDQLAGCHVQCNAPQCRMFCPKDICEGRKTLDCQTPKCTTRCEKPQCRFLCNDGLKCKSVCPDPICDWECKKPQECPKPDCKMVCEKPPECDVDTKPTLPPKGDHETVGSTGKAGLGDSKWNADAWGACSAVCGKGSRTRSVSCSSGYDTDCHGAKPATSEECQDFSGCQYAVGQWSQCSAHCGDGTQTRAVNCAGPSCSGTKPASVQKCSHSGKECTDCHAVVFGGPNFDGWSLTFEPGKYSNSDMELKGAKCDDISSVKVFGDFCHMTAFEFGDFNKKHHGWQAEFGSGAFTNKDLLARGAKDNDISSLIVEKRGGPAGQNATYSAGQAGQAGNASKNGIAPGWNGTWPMHGSAAVASWTVAALAALLLS